ncbi:YciI family protein [Microvirga sp. 2YAF29]|uniref:YciI family protein n=1 Tax=Microvirga sp. 2YAF29 TaxID=3233031 RepID=UPI003F9555E7
MTRWVAIFDDLPGMADIRQERESLHFDYLKENRDKIRIGGGLREVPGGPFLGALWVLETDTREEAVRLIENDPYCRSGCRQYRLLFWGKAFEDVPVIL